MRRALLLLFLCLSLSLAPHAWSQGQLIPGNRTLAGTLNAGASGGTPNAYTLVLDPAMPAYVAQQLFVFKAAFTNTGPATLTVNLLAARPLKKWLGGALVQLSAGDIHIGQEVEVYYDGTDMQVLSLSGQSGSLGPAGTLQAADGNGGLAAFSGSRCNDPATVQVGMTSSGAALCLAPPSSSTSGHVLTDRAETGFPNAVNLGARPAGILSTTVSGGVATVTSLPQPAGGLVGTTATQELDNKRVNARTVSLPDQATLTVDLSTTDVAYIAALSQATTFQNPTGTAKPGQWLRLQVASASPQPLLWGSLWQTGVGFPKPTHTSGAPIYDTFLWQYNPITGGLDLIYNSQLAALTLPTGVAPGDYHCPTNIHIDPTGRIGGITASVCGSGGGGGGGGGTASSAGLAGDIQMQSADGALVADSGRFTHDVTSHWTTVQQLLSGTGTGAVGLLDPHGYTHTLRAPNLTGPRVMYAPDRSGVVPLTDGGTPGHLAVYASDGVGLVDGGVPGGGTGGGVVISGSNTLVGTSAGAAITTETDNTLVGYQAALSATGANGNTSIGSGSSHNLGTGDYNTVMGYLAGFALSSGGYNTLLGNNAGASITTGGSNVAIGSGAISAGSAGGIYNNVAIGTSAGVHLGTGVSNTIIGDAAGLALTSGNFNMLLGANAGTAMTTTSDNVAIGANASAAATTASENTVIGSGAGVTETSANQNLTGNQNVYIGRQAGPGTTTQLSNSVAIGYQAHATASNQTVLGNSSTTQTVINGRVSAPKGIAKRVTTLTSSTTFQCAGDTNDQCKMAMTGVAGTLNINGPTGTPNDGDLLLYRLRCTNLQTVVMDSSVYLPSPNVPLVTSCPADTTKELVIGVMYSSDLAKWQILASN